MRSRLLAGAILIASGLIAWLAISAWPAARLLQGAIGLSLLYVAYLAWRGWRVMRDAREPTAVPGSRPWITVLVPAADESAVIATVVADLIGQDYADGRERRFDVLVLDDGSSDGTGELARVAAEPAPDAVTVCRREAGTGPRTKGAALAWAQPRVRGDVVAVIDADAHVASDFLAGAMAAWSRDPGAAALQVQRRDANRRSGWLTAAQDEEQLMDMASQCGRWSTDGTAELRGNGMLIRRDRLEAVGGWSPTALTEDLEMSTRLTLHGERVALAPEVRVMEQAVESVGALWRQRMRWAEGSLRRLMELGPSLVANRALPLGRRLDFIVFIGEFVIPPLFAASIVASLLTVVLPRPADWTVPITLFIGYALGTYLLALAGLAASGERSLRILGRSLRGSLFLSHWLLVVPAALLRIALWPPTTDFARTARRSMVDR
ncbi:MAG TPA: glycosyltransferase family 2 protein [Candidatus Limnocylindria bacterium]|nr:glycosyltransferase family 2 protein [Candidatus Limnocylindria bacterium]